MKKFLSFLFIVLTLGLMISLCGCDEQDNTEDNVLASSSTELLTASLLTIKGDNTAGILIKEAIDNIIDYNIKSDDKVFVEWMDSEFTETDDLNEIISLIDDDQLFSVLVEYDSRDFAKGIRLISNAPIIEEEELIIIDDEEAQEEVE